MKVKEITFILFCLYQAGILIAQQPSIIYTLDKYGSYVEKLEFPLSGKSFDVMANNPYNHLDYPEIEINRYGGKVYSLENIKESGSDFFTSKKYRPTYAEDLKRVYEKQHIHVMIKRQLIGQHLANFHSYALL